MATIRVSGTVQTTPGGPTTISSPNNPVNVIGSSFTVVNTSTINTSATNYSQSAYAISISASAANVGNPTDTPFDPNSIYDTTANRQKAAVYIAGGLGVEKDVNVGGFIYGRVATAVTSTLLSVSDTNEDIEFYPTFVRNFTNSATGAILYGDSTGTFSALTYNPKQGKLTVEQQYVSSATQSTSTTTGALVVNGGVGIGGNLTVDDIYTQVLTSLAGNKIQIAPDAGVTEVIGDIRVRGQNPIGTAPVVTNVLYVTMDGNDSNDGRAEDASRACRTVTGAVNSPYYQSGTQIRVAPGHYLEDNPIQLKPYTSVMGSDIRTTSIEPINKTQDLFHMNSGCYLAFMQFLNGRSGLLEGDYNAEFNRGAYCTAFPPLPEEERIDLYHSPYIQNCTNLSGPWLKDGTMFVPNQTVQIPEAVGIGSWPAGTSTIVVNVDSGIIRQGMAVNAGQQNPGFFDARTLMLANKQFLQEQVVAFVDYTFNSGTFVYDTVKCERDTGLIIDSIATDMLQDSISDSVFAGLQYWRQGGYVDAIGNQITTTTAAINYVKNLAVGVAAAAASSTEGAIVGDRFDNILEILGTATSTLATGEFAEWVTNNIVSNSTASDVTSYINAFNALIDAKDSIADQTISYIDGLIDPFVYYQDKCERDTGLIVDAIVQDLLFDGTSQSTFAGLQYWNQSSYVDGIAGEITTTTAAISYVKDLAKKVVVGDTSGTRYQTTVTQNTSLTAATAAEVLVVSDEFDTILNILDVGTAGITDAIEPNGITESADVNVLYAYNLLQANKDYLKAEAIAFVEATKTVGFVYDQTLCARDVGYMIDSVSFDLLYGGNKQAIQSGVYYYGYDDSSTAIANEIPQTTAAYNYIKSLLSNVIRGIEISTSTLYQLGVSQEFGIPGTPIEADHAKQKVDIIIDIINNGPSVVDKKRPISLTKSIDPYVASAAQLLHNNRNFIKAEVVAYVDSLGEFVYNRDTCRRDVGYMIDSVAFDLLHGGNKQSIKSGVYYFGYSSNTTEIPGEIPQTAAAYSFIKTLLTNVITANTSTSVYQTGTVQVTNLPAATDNEIAILNSKIDVITDIIRNGPDAVNSKEPIALIQSENSNILNAYNLLKENTDFIKAEVIAYLNQFGQFNYSREFCYRDVGILVENVSYDAAFGGNQKAIESGLAYYDGVVSKISGQEPQTIAAIDHLNQMIQSIIINNTVTNIYPVPAVVSPYGTHSQVINTAVSEGAIAGRSIDDLFNIINTIIENGPDAAPALYTGTNVDAAFVSAEILMQANRTFIQEDTLNYINNITQEFSYNQIKCRRDTGLIVDAIAIDLLYPTPEHSQSTFAGLQYWNQDGYTGQIANELSPTIKAVQYLRDLSVKIIQNITPTDDLINRYQTGTVQVTSLEPATLSEADTIKTNFGYILSILGGNSKGWTDRFVLNGTPSQINSVHNAIALLQANKDYMANEVTAFVDATNSNFSYSTSTCQRDVGYIIDSVAFDLLHGGNKQSIQAGLSYYGFDTENISIRNQEIQTTNAFDHLASIASQIVQGQPVIALQKKVKQVFLEAVATGAEVTKINESVSTITNIINNGPAVAAEQVPVTLTADSSVTVAAAYDQLQANKKFIVEEVIAFIDNTYNANSFRYDEELCYRDTGLIVDAVSQDILLGGNYKSIEAGLAYWNYGVSHVGGQETTTTMALNYARDLALQIIANQPVTPQTATIATQIINPFFQYGGDYMPQQAVRRSFDTITKIINDGPQYAPPRYMGGGLSALTGINGADVINSPQVVSVSEQEPNVYLIGLNTSTVGFGTNATLYFGETLVFPKQDNEVEELSLEFTGSTSTWDQRKTDPIGSMGGSLVDGAVISARSPIQSFVYDAFTQLTQGGRGIRITNDGYAQLVSVFTIFASVGVQTDNGGIASIVNSNANFGDICLLSKGYGVRKFSGTIYNPRFKAYPSSPDIPGGDYFDQYYPNGFWPNGGKVQVFLPDTDDRAHISLIMEVVPPETVYDVTGAPQPQINEQGFPGFLNARPSKSVLSTGSITITDIDTEGIAIGNYIYIRDIDNNQGYVATGTIVTDVGFRSVTLNKALTNGGGDIENPDYFTLLFCGNAYYTVLSSELAANPKPTGTNVLSVAAGLPTDQVAAHISSINYLKSLTIQIINNNRIDYLQTASEQTITPLVVGGGNSETFINLRFKEMTDIIGAATVTAAEAVIPKRLRTKRGTVPQGAGSAISLIQSNIEFLADEISAYVTTTYPGLVFDEVKCQRDVKIILQRLIYDIETGGNYNSVTTGLSYWSRNGTHHLVQLGENVRRTDLFPDGATVNFYQRSYISASGYVFEYVGAGTNYGALPQRGIKDPIQSKETVQLSGGKVFFTSTDQNGDFRIGPGLVISQATGVLSGRTFTKSLFANMTPFILAIEGGGI
jgi:hypothetical protein